MEILPSPDSDYLLAEPGQRGAPQVDQPLAHHANRPWRSVAWLEATYPLPKATRSLEEFLRMSHQDLPSLSGLEIDLELDAVRNRLRFESNPRHIPWLHARTEVLAEWRQRWFGEDPSPAPTPSSQPTHPQSTTSQAATTVIQIRGRGRGR